MISLDRLSFKIRRDPGYATRDWHAPKPPYRFAVVLVKKGTLEGNELLVMADEMMAESVASGLKAASPLVESAKVVLFGERPPEVNAWFFMHHFPIDEVANLVQNDPAWLWVHNPGVWNAVELMSASSRVYSGIFHAGRIMAPRIGARLFVHTLEDESIFKPISSQKRDENGIVFIGNAAMHVNLVHVLARLCHAGKCNVYGHGWNNFGIPNLGRLPMREAPRILTSASVCIDSVSKMHNEEGMTSTRVHQALACGSAVVSNQNPDFFPEEMRKHILFVDSDDALVDGALRLARDAMARNALRHKASLCVRRHTLRFACRSLWSSMHEDLKNAMRIAR